MDDVLEPNDRRYNDKQDQPFDIDDLNTDIAHAAVKLIKNKMQSHVGTTFQLPVTVTDIGDEALAQGLCVRPPCRFEVVERYFLPEDGTMMPYPQGDACVKLDVVLDIAHNEDAIVALVRKMKAKYSNIPLRFNECLAPTKAFHLME